MLHWTGAAWSQVNIGTANNIGGIWGSSANDVRVVGDFLMVLVGP